MFEFSGVVGRIEALIGYPVEREGCMSIGQRVLKKKTHLCQNSAALLLQCSSGRADGRLGGWREGTYRPTRASLTAMRSHPIADMPVFITGSVETATPAGALGYCCRIGGRTKLCWGLS
jgi:hypothetical protein